MKLVLFRRWHLMTIIIVCYVDCHRKFKAGSSRNGQYIVRHIQTLSLCMALINCCYTNEAYCHETKCLRITSGYIIIKRRKIAFLSPNIQKEKLNHAISFSKVNLRSSPLNQGKQPKEYKTSTSIFEEWQELQVAVSISLPRASKFPSSNCSYDNSCRLFDE